MSSIVWMLLLALAAGCAATTAEVAPAATPTPEVVAPAEVVAAREAVLNFVREGANCVCPPANARWEASVGRAPDGFSVYRFHTGDTSVLVSYATPLAAETAFHVGMHDEQDGICWQAIVSGTGRVTTTGVAAELMPELAVAAEAYCKEQGFGYEIRTQADGSRCGVCLFSDGRSCKAWTYYQGECGPG
jgi:putative hemolysin